MIVHYPLFNRIKATHETKTLFAFVASLLATSDTAMARYRLSIAAIDYAEALLRSQALLDRDKNNGSCRISFLGLFSLSGEATLVVAIARDGIAVAVLDEAHAVESSGAAVDKGDCATGVAAARPADTVVSVNDAVAVQGRGSNSLLLLIMSVGVGVSCLVAGRAY